MNTVDAPYTREVGNGIRIVSTHSDHVEELEQLQKIVFPTLDSNSLMRAEHYLNHIAIFPEGQFVAIKDNKVVGMTTSIRYHLNLQDSHTFTDVFDNGFLNTHEVSGDWLYGMDIGTHPAYRGVGIASYLYDARQSTVEILGLKGQYTYGMMSGYGKMKESLTPNKYYEKLLAGELKDPTVSHQMKNGFVPYRLVAGYVNDPICDGYCVLLIRENKQKII